MTDTEQFTLQNFLILCVCVYTGVYELTQDNRTVSGQTINAVEQLSLYPELLSSLLYKLSGSQVRSDQNPRFD